MKANMILGILIATSVVFGACQKKEGCTHASAINYDNEADTDDGSCEYLTTLEVPVTYTFTDVEGNNTVGNNGQAQRLEMLSEITSYMKTANTSGTAVDGQILHDMYANANGHIWADADSLGMTGSTKNLRSKTAASSGVADPALQQYFEDLINELASASATTMVNLPQGENGVDGVVVSTSNPTKIYLQAGDGREWVQLVEKGLMGACLMNQISSWYLADAQMDVDNTTAVDPDNDKFYTQMEHHWDEAYGYFTTATDYPTNGTNRFWGKYADGREEHLGTGSAIGQAFRTGRAAISEGDLDTRDAQIVIIRHNLELAAVGTAIHYLNNAVDDFADDALRNHVLSEATAFMQAIPYGHDAQMTVSDVNAQIDALGSFYTVSSTTIQQVKEALVERYGLQAVADQL